MRIVIEDKALDYIRSRGGAVTVEKPKAAVG